MHRCADCDRRRFRLALTRDADGEYRCREKVECNFARVAKEYESQPQPTAPFYRYTPRTHRYTPPSRAAEPHPLRWSAPTPRTHDTYNFPITIDMEDGRLPWQLPGYDTHAFALDVATQPPSSSDSCSSSSDSSSSDTSSSSDFSGGGGDFGGGGASGEW